ncbi:SDR family oxidoreductase [Flammeovirga yaeyamensis]|uniref:SDR family oxidoreductase n=1 Tax=Flammeovirga yaeyamensis TaxID=367791 RepID=A0AAX1N7Y7_9BACT|nr:SDR family oxidoreductase [Flammeovirga yaeyamensis]MBB3700588.1 short-subunit dehydrogenase [Flammeovirga yaeyamensis]NMF37704.1 SDR family oxidoreductase [Flammeovirga yaeyamensis]QWG02013.1 SDR family oxidoreductase [Flammeovirga yaeyamensis]
MKESRFNQKVYWVVGASSGIGKQLAISLSQFPCKLIISARNESALIDLQNEYQKEDSITVLPMDLSASQKELTDISHQAYQIHQQLDGIFLVGGISQRASFEEMALSTFEKIMQVNFWGALHITKAVLPYLKKSDDPMIVCINSVQGKMGIPDRTAYAASKHALLGFMDSLRAELHPFGIQITNILPGYVKTDLAKNALQADGSQQGQLDEGKGGITVEKAALDILHYASIGKSEAVIGRPREQAAVYIKRFFPKLLEKLVRKKS